MNFRPAINDAELIQILELQQANLYTNLTPKEREREGFLKIKHNLGLLREMQSKAPQIIALNDKILAGYALGMHKSQSSLIPELSPLFEFAASKLPVVTDYIIMGQICVSKDYRRKGYFSKLYHTLKSHCNGLPVVTEIASINERSLAAHKAIGFELLGSHQEVDFNWHVVIWK